MNPVPMVVGFLSRDARREFSYPVNVLVQAFALFFTVVLWHFTARFVAPPSSAAIPGGDWFSFVVLGWAWLQYLQVSLFSFASNLREEQLAGTLEMLLSTPRREEGLILSLALWDYLWQTTQIALLLGMASLFGLRWNVAAAGLLPAALLLLLTVAVYVGVGLFAAAFTVAFKKGTSLAIFASSASILFGGVLYPAEVLGPRLAKLAAVVPATYVNHGLRAVLLGGGGFPDVTRDLAALALFAALLLPAGLLAFRVAVERSRRRGDLASY